MFYIVKQNVVGRVHACTADGRRRATTTTVPACDRVYGQRLPRPRAYRTRGIAAVRERGITIKYIIYYFRDLTERIKRAERGSSGSSSR